MIQTLCNRIAVLIVLLCTSCNNASNQYDKELVILIDRSDPLRVNPNADEIISKLGLKQDIWQSVRVLVSYVSDKDINAGKLIELAHASRFTGNKQLRGAEVEHFKKELQAFLKDTHMRGSLTHSIIYRTIAKHLNVLSASNAKEKIFLVYSNLMENADLSFYNPEAVKALHTKPGIIRQTLEKGAVLHKLPGIQVWLIYDPVSFEENNTYMAIAQLYRQILESKGATVHIENTLNL